MWPGTKHLYGFVLAGLLSACGGPYQPPAIRSSPPILFDPQPVLGVDNLPGFAAEKKSVVLAAFASSCNRLDASFIDACVAARGVAPGDEAAATQVLLRYFRTASLGTAAVTGYFELTVAGSLTPSAQFNVPVYRAPARPRDYGRAEIIGGALNGRGLELVYLQSLTDLYFLQLQGSGRVVLQNGQVMRLGTAASNGRPRASIEALFGDAPVPGRDLSIPGIRAWAQQNPSDVYSRLSRDQAYVFFRTTQDIPLQYGPYGAFGLPLLPLRSVAIDPRITPLGSLMWLSAANSANNTLLPHLVIAHDTGDLIQGAGRVDLFYGWGDQAEWDGGHENAQGQLWVLLPR